MTIQVIWDPAKSASNKRKHGIAFHDAAAVFSDEFALTEQDRIEGFEYRWQTIGIVDGTAVVTVAHTTYEEDDVEVIRIISARRADRQERKRYEEARYGRLRN
jgi:uncharacterized DUF497 family protein